MKLFGSCFKINNQKIKELKMISLDKRIKSFRNGKIWLININKSSININ
jgi:hypothetical protein